ncbi:MAG: DUF4340 domain-containing protein [Bdellovibrionales bacterium]|nr:DUF4340 domain-containing protein [Bdellovibrionales bacterium]
MNKLTGVFFVLALVFGGIAYYEYENSKEEKVEKAREAQIIGWGQEELVSATLEKSGKLLKVERRDGDWWLVQPFEDMADQFNVNSWAGDIATEKGAKLDAKKTAAGDVFWAEYGLDRDLTILTIENESGDKAVVSFAKNAAFDGQFFSRYKNDVYIAVRPWAGVMAKSADNLRNRDVFRKKSKIEKVRMQVMGDDYTLIRAEGETWSMQDDESFKFDLNDGTAFGRQLSGLRIESFVDDSSALKNLKTFGLDKPVGVLTVSMAGQGEQQLQIGKVAKKAGQEDDKYYAKASDAK